MLNRTLLAALVALGAALLVITYVPGLSLFTLD